jgi:hypothetical protein
MIFKNCWLSPALKLIPCELSPVFKIFQGDTQPSSLRHLTPEGRMALAKVTQAIHDSCVGYFQSIQLLILPTVGLPTGVLWQTQGVLERLCLPHSPARVIPSYHIVVTKLTAMGHFHMYSC